MELFLNEVIDLFVGILPYYYQRMTAWILYYLRTARVLYVHNTLPFSFMAARKFMFSNE